MPAKADALLILSREVNFLIVGETNKILWPVPCHAQAVAFDHVAAQVTAAGFGGRVHSQTLTVWQVVTPHHMCHSLTRLQAVILCSPQGPLMRRA